MHTNILLLPLIFILSLSACTTSITVNSVEDRAGFDSALAQELGADEYGMRSYVMVVLKTGPAKITDKARRSEIFAGHFSNMTRLSEEGKLVLAGPFMDAGDKRGLYIFNVTTIEQAKVIVQSDPAVAAGIFVPEFTKYYGSAALLKINELHKKIQKTKIG